jgi:hypothetical protein
LAVDVVGDVVFGAGIAVIVVLGWRRLAVP